MKKQTTVNMEPFLKETYYCDYNNPVLKGVVNTIKSDSKNHREIAVSLFYFVRDYTEYRVGNWNRKASETFIEKSGTCTNNANLLVALCRLCGIPAGYIILEVSGPEYFGPVILPQFASKISKKTKHVYACVFLDGQWVKCDPSDDKTLSLSTQHINPPSRIVEWDGFKHAVLNIEPKHILGEVGPVHNIDHIIVKKQRILLYFTVKIANKYISYLRNRGTKITHVRQLDSDFSKWLMKENFFLYIIYVLTVALPYRLFRK